MLAGGGRLFQEEGGGKATPFLLDPHPPLRHVPTLTESLVAERELGGEAEGYSFSTSFARVRLALVDLVEIEGELDFFVAERMVLAQRMADPVGRQQDATQVGVAAEGDAEHVEDLALVPIGSRVDRLHAVGLRARPPP